MRRPHNLSRLALAAALTFTLVGFQGAVAQQAPKVAVKIDATKCPEIPQEVAYETLMTFVPWLLARAERMTVIGDAERRAIFRAFAEQQLWRTGIPAGGGGEG
jgi:hypothetical protein